MKRRVYILLALLLVLEPILPSFIAQEKAIAQEVDENTVVDTGDNIFIEDGNSEKTWSENRVVDGDGQAENELNKDEEQEGTDTGDLTDENGSNEEMGKNSNLSPLSILASEMDEDVELNFVMLKVKGKEITDPNQAQAVEPVLGDDVSVHYSFEINPTKDYGVGSTFKFDLPKALLNFDPQSLSGELTFEDIKFRYTTSGNTVTVSLVEGTVEDSTPFVGKLNFYAEFAAIEAGDDLEQELVIPIAGGESLSFLFVFRPKSTGESMYKTGAPAILANGDRVINWEVWTNREGADLQNAQLDDILGNGHELTGNIAVEQYKVGLNGVAENPIHTNTATAFPVELENGRYAYKLTYRTVVIRKAENEKETFSNSATLTNNGSKSGIVQASVTHTYGTKLDKRVIKEDKYQASWEIKYNYFGSKISSQTLTDTVTAPHKIKKESVKVYNVTVNPDGSGVKGSEVSPTITPTFSNNDRTFTLNLPSPNGEAYLIEYDTVLDSEYVITGATINNTVSYGEYSISRNFKYSEDIFGKTRVSIDYDKKEITWRLRVNAERAMKDLEITDAFTPYTDGGTRQELIIPNPDNLNSAFTITNGVTPTSVALEKNEREGFKLEFTNLNQGKNFTITYKTRFDLKPNGLAYPEYENKANANWKHPTTNTQYSILDKTASYAPGDSPTGNNGYKNGSFNHVNQVFNWNVAVNINKQNINNAEVVDVIGEGHELVEDTIKVHKLILGADDRGTKGAEVTSGFNISEQSKQGFTIKFTEDTTDAYIITYETKDSDAIIGQKDGSGEYRNVATFKTIDDKEFKLPASTIVQHANKLIAKNPNANPADETIKWTIDVNQSHSKLGDITLTDTMSSNQLILPDTFRMREIKMNAQGTISYGDWKTVTPIINSEDNSFTLDLGNLDQKGYQIEYKTFFLGGDGDTFSNVASLNYIGSIIGTSKEEHQSNIPFNFNDSSGTISSKKGDLELHKVGLNPLTGEQVNLEGITFHLLNKTGTIKIAEATTDSHGKLTFKDIRYGRYKLEEQGTPNGYIELPAFEITMDDSKNFKENGGNAYVVENVEDVGMENACQEFTLTVKNVDGKVNEGVQVKLVNKNTGVEVTPTKKTNSQGQVSIARNILPAGPYEVFEIDGVTADKLGEVIVNYGSCVAEVQPAPTCPDFAITVNDEKGNARSNVPVTVKDKDGKEIITKTTNSEGKITVDSSILPAGTYDLFEGGLYIGEIEVSYLVSCEVKLSPISAPSCPRFTLTVQDRNGKPQDNVRVTVKDKDGTTITDGTTDGNGKLFFPNIIEKGLYNVYGENNQFIGSFTVVNTCEAIVKPSSGGGGYVPPITVDPEEPGAPTEPPVDPEEPGTPTEPPVDPEEPGTPTEPPVDPEEPGTPTEPPVDPEEPGTPTEPPVDQGGSDSNKQNNKTKPSTEGNATDGNELSKLPQTGEQKYMYMIIFGLLFMIMGGYVLFRKSKYEA